jgi:hypothetical protein
MHPATLERALHEWPLWEETIFQARTDLDFEPAVLEAEAQTKKWEAKVGWGRLVEACLEAMSKMGLPWYFGFYWMACFCADYRRGQSVDYSQIKAPPQNASQAWGQRVREQFLKDKGIVMLYHKVGPEGKLYPPYPFLIETSFLFPLDRGEKPPEFETYGKVKVKKDGKLQEVSGLFEVDNDGYVSPSADGSIRRGVVQIKVPAETYVEIFFGEKRAIPPKFAVEFPMFLATEDVVSLAFKQIQVYREGVRHYLPHPLLTYSEKVKTKADTHIAERMRGPKEDIDRYTKGELSFEELIRNEWERELTQKGTVALRLKHRQVGLLEAQRAIYHRVRRRLVRRGIIPPRPKKGWRSALKYRKIM